jgi:hypothetical protein
MKKILTLLILTMTLYTGFAQDTKVYFGLGGQYNSFQDTRFSDVQFNKASIVPEIGFYRISTVDYWYLNANAFIFNTNFPGSDTIKIATLGYNVKLGYLRNYKGHYIGGAWTVLDYISRDNNLLGNNSNFYRLASDIFVSWKYKYTLNDNWNIDLGVDYGLLSFINTAPSFTANFPQNVVDNGEVSFSDASSRDPYNLGNMTAKYFGNQLNINSILRANFRNRFSLAYEWRVRSYSDNAGYPVTDATHSIMLQFNFISHTKN